MPSTAPATCCAATSRGTSSDQRSCFLVHSPVTAMVSLSPAAAITLTALLLLELLQRPADAAWKGLGPQPAGSGAQSTLPADAACDAAPRARFCDLCRGVSALVWHEWPSCARWLRHCIGVTLTCWPGGRIFQQERHTIELSRQRTMLNNHLLRSALRGFPGRNKSPFSSTKGMLMLLK
jgi:hypothetical protein